MKFGKISDKYFMEQKKVCFKIVGKKVFNVCGFQKVMLYLRFLRALYAMFGTHN